MSEVEERLLEETDYDLEIKRSIEFSEACKNIPNLIFPTYFPELSSKRIITMGWLDGLHMKEFMKTNPSQDICNQVGQALWDFYNFQQHELRAVHADPHPGNFLITPDGKLGVIDFGCIKEMPADFYEPFFSMTSTNMLQDKAKTIKTFRELEMIRKDDTPAQIEFFYQVYKEMIELFALPYMSQTFDFSKKEYFDNLYNYGERIARMPEFKQARGVKHFIYVNRTNFGLYNMLHELGAMVRTDTWKPHINTPQ
jgi:predicted unusual protein kinase regulating ubiquinone biosynthesis (AarF/ABC1/UbiB family)